jgi:uncharacterized protein YndB with AHSA1/START domain
MGRAPAGYALFVFSLALQSSGIPARAAEEHTMAAAGKAAKVAPQDIVLVRTFDAPVEAVWKAWSDPREVERWWGPKQYTSPFAKIDFREGGRYVFAMKAPESHGGHETYTAGTFGKIVPMQRIELTQGLSDRDGNPVDPASLGMPPDFPREIPTVVTFKPVAGKTTVTVVEGGWTPGQMLDFSEAGMSECLDKLAETLPKR